MKLELVKLPTDNLPKKYCIVRPRATSHGRPLCAHCGRVARKHFWRDASGELHGFCRYHAEVDLRPVYDERKWPT